MAWIAALGAALGISLRPSWALLTTLLVLGFAGPRRGSAMVLIGCAALGGLRASHTSSQDPVVASVVASVSTCSIDARVSNVVGPTGTVLELQRLACLGRWMDVDATAILDGFEAEPGARVGGRVRFIPLGSDAWSVLATRLGAEAKLLPVELEVTDDPQGIQGVALDARLLMRRATVPLSPTSGALLRGLTIGDTEGMPAEDEDLLRRAGLSHLVAVSGSNVAIVLGSLLLLTRRAGPMIGYPIAIAGLVLYVFVVGFEPSVLRAAVMGTIGCCAALFGSRSEPLAALGTAVTIVLLFQPWLLWSAGLQLSVAATLGIVLWAPAIAERVPAPRPVALALGVTCAAQIAVAPVLIATFGSLSIAGVAANVLAAPAVPIATVAGSLAGLLAAISLPIARVLMIPAGLAASWIAWVGRLFGGFSWAEWHLPVLVAVAIALGLAWPAIRGGRALLQRKPGYP
jgi:competence protein ComEC